jgi:nitrogen fixation protein FixH
MIILKRLEMSSPQSIAVPSPASDGVGRLTARKVALIFTLFFGTIFSADTFLIVSAIRTYTGAETTSAYRAGQLYHEEIALARAQAARGWRLDATAERAADGTVSLRVVLENGQGEALSKRALKAALQRPTDRRADHADIALAETVAAGRYAGLVAEIAPGQWDLVVDVLEGGERAFRRKTRVVLR